MIDRQVILFDGKFYKNYRTASFSAIYEVLTIEGNDVCGEIFEIEYISITNC
jgi:hypothetical protein